MPPPNLSSRALVARTHAKLLTRHGLRRSLVDEHVLRQVLRAQVGLVCATAALVSLYAVAARHCALHVDIGRWGKTHRPNPDSSSVRSHVIGPTKICHNFASTRPLQHESSRGR
jgi:hypothetical protein